MQMNYNFNSAFRQLLFTLIYSVVFINLNANALLFGVICALCGLATEYIFQLYKYYK